MNGVLHAVLAGSVLSPVAGDSSANDRQGLAELQGKWVIQTVERSSKIDDSFTGAVRMIDGDQYTLARRAAPAIHGTLSVDARKQTFDMKPRDGDYQGRDLLGIYQLDGDSLHICFAEPGRPRPTDFTSKPGSGHIVVLQKRAP
jgi:uncharacterized protein (TIGR03067 family)